LLAACWRKGIDRIVITDHNNIAGALHAQRLDPQRVIVGEEIRTQAGEFLAAYVQEEIPPGLPYQEAITRLREQGAFISVSHPFDITRGGHWSQSDLLEIAPLIDAIEIFNSRCVSRSFNTQAAEFARLNNLPGTVGSDSHTILELGRATMHLPPFESASDLRQVISQAQYQTVLSSFWVHFASRYAAWRKKTAPQRS